MISESEYLAPAVLLEKGKVAAQIMYSNVKEIVEEHNVNETNVSIYVVRMYIIFDYEQ